MGEKLTITLSEQRMDYLRKVAGGLGQPLATVGGELFSRLLDDMQRDDDAQKIVPVPFKGTVKS